MPRQRKRGNARLNMPFPLGWNKVSKMSRSATRIRPVPSSESDRVTKLLHISLLSSPPTAYARALTPFGCYLPCETAHSPSQVCYTYPASCRLHAVWARLSAPARVPWQGHTVRILASYSPLGQLGRVEDHEGHRVGLGSSMVTFKDGYKVV